MFFQKKKAPSLIDLLSDSLNKDYDRFVKNIFKTEQVSSEQKIELGTYLAFLYIHVMLVREVQINLALTFPTNKGLLPMFSDDEKEKLAYIYRERMENYSNIISGAGDKDKILNISALFLSHFYNFTQEQVTEQKSPQLMASELYSTIILKSVIQMVDLYISTYGQPKPLIQ